MVAYSQQPQSGIFVHDHMSCKNFHDAVIQRASEASVTIDGIGEITDAKGC